MIEFKNVIKKYGDKEVLRGISFRIEEGKIVVFLGSSGCGKTTTLKLINRLVEPTSGEITYNGEDIRGKDVIKYRRNIGYVLQNTGLFPHMTIRENLELLPRIEKMPDEQIEKNNLRLLDMIGLDPFEYLDRYPGQLSGGQKQRVGVARAFSLNPDLILMDEPFSAVDPIIRVTLQDELTRIQRDRKKTIVFVTHDIHEAFRIADKICLLESGEIVQYGTPKSIVEHPANEFVKTFIQKILQPNVKFFESEQDA